MLKSLFLVDKFIYLKFDYYYISFDCLFTDIGQGSLPGGIRFRVAGSRNYGSRVDSCRPLHALRVESFHSRPAENISASHRRVLDHRRVLPPGREGGRGVPGPPTPHWVLNQPLN